MSTTSVTCRFAMISNCEIIIFFSFRSEAVVEYVFGGSRLKLYLPKETCLITFLLAGEY